MNKTSLDYINFFSSDLKYFRESLKVGWALRLHVLQIDWDV
jgi:hypothetical protein